MHEGNFVPEYLRLTIPKKGGEPVMISRKLCGILPMQACSRRTLMRSVEDPMAFFFGSGNPQHSPPHGWSGLKNPDKEKGGISRPS
jgi:hypothetical protein